MFLFETTKLNKNFEISKKLTIFANSNNKLHMKKIVYILSILSILVFASCDAEFDPNDDWQENMMIYCLLDQDDDITYVRVEKCFLGNGNAYDFAKTKDSVYYPVEDLEVKLYACQMGDTSKVIKTFDFKDTLVSKYGGDFYYDNACPVYYCNTKGQLSYHYTYKLTIKNLKTGKVVTGITHLLSDYSIQNTTFYFTSRNQTMDIIWGNKYVTQDFDQRTVAKKFKIDVKFNYTIDGAIHTLNIPCSDKTNNNSSFEHSHQLSMQYVLDVIKNGLKDKYNMKWYGAKPFEICVSACDLSLSDYMSINEFSDKGLNYIPMYSNIEGGYGLFASRRAHISKEFKDREIYPELKTAIASFGHGFEQ